MIDSEYVLKLLVELYEAQEEIKITYEIGDIKKERRK